MALRRVTLPVRKAFDSRKRRIYLAITAVLLLLLAIVAISILHSAADRSNREYTQKARESMSAGDYESALLYLRRVKNAEDSPEVLMLMADCYEAMGNYPRALETLRKMNTSDPAISNRIQSIEQMKIQQGQEKRVSIAGTEFDVTAQTAVLDGMNLTDTDLRELTALYSLDKLSLKNNHITDIQPLAQLGGLDELNLTGNQIRDISALESLNGLRILVLDGNPVKKCEALKKITHLKSLSVLDTLLETEDLLQLSEMIPGCAIRFDKGGEETILLAGEVYQLNATELILAGKKLTDISVLSSFKELKILDLSDNDVSELGPLMDLSQLEKVNLSGNSVSDLRPLIGLPLLTVLNVSDNLISETSSVGSVEKLVELNLSGNLIRDYSGLGRLSNLKVLNLSRTGITDSDLPELYPLKALYNLDLRENYGLSDIAVGALKSELPGCGIATPELVYEIDFSGHLVRSDETNIAFPAGGITDLSALTKLSHLEELNLRDNEINNLYPLEVTPSRDKIRRLDLAGNNIMDVLSLYALSTIEELDLSGNQIEVVAGLRKLTTLRWLDLSGNPVSLEAVNDLRSWLPDCTIIFS